MKKRIKNELLKNAIGSLNIGFKSFLKIYDEPLEIFNYISAIRNIHSGFYLLLKSQIESRAPKHAKLNILAAQHKMGIVNGKLTFIPKDNRTIGTDQIIERLKIVNIIPDFTQKDLTNLNALRNEIEHHYPTLQPETDEYEFYNNWIIKSFDLIIQFNSKYSKINVAELLGKEVFEKINELKDKKGNTSKELLNTYKSKNNDNFKLSSDLINRLSFLFENYYEEEEEPNCGSLLLNANCPECSSSKLVPINFPKRKKLHFKIKCESCKTELYFKNIMIHILAVFYSYEMMKSRAKGGVFPLNKCSSCKTNAFLNYEKICFYCGSTEPPIELTGSEINEIDKLNPQIY